MAVCESPLYQKIIFEQSCLQQSDNLVLVFIVSISNFQNPESSGQFQSGEKLGTMWGFFDDELTTKLL